MEVASTKEDEYLTADDIASLPEGRERLEPYADWFRNDREVQARVASTWNNLVREGRHRSLPPAISEQLANRHWEDYSYMFSRVGPYYVK